MSKGFIPIRRSLFEHFLYKEHRVFSRFEAWLDLIQLASFADGQTDVIKGKTITRNRGEVVASIRWLASRWNWSSHRTFDFVEVLRSQDMVVAGVENGITKLTLVNFERHNSIGNGLGNSKNGHSIEFGRINGTDQGTGRRKKKNSYGSGLGNSETQDSITSHENSGTDQGTKTGTNGEQSGNSEGTNNKEDNNSKNQKRGNSADAPPPQGDLKLLSKQEDMIRRKELFYNQLAGYVNTYGAAMIRKFFDYWTEPNKSRTKMGFELEDTWDTALRLKTWEDRELKWKKGGPGESQLKPPAAPALSKVQEELNYFYARWLEDPGSVTVISVDWHHFNEVRKAELFIPDDDEVETMKSKAGDYLREKGLAADPDSLTKMAKRFGVLLFFQRCRGEGLTEIFTLKTK